MTKEEFLADPLRQWYSHQQHEVQTQWFAKAWRTSSHFKSEISYELGRYAGKTGAFWADETLFHLSQFLNQDDVLQLHQYILRKARRESDWRDEFERWFPYCADALPPVEDDD
jgi:hypothetical protein